MIKSALALLCLALAYFLFWPVGAEPVAWSSPPNPGYQGVYATNHALSDLQRISLGKLHGPEDIARDEKGVLYATTGEGFIVKVSPSGQVEPWVETGGRPLGIQFDSQGNLIVADAYRGLLQVDPAGQLSTLTQSVDDTPIRYADDVDVAQDGKIYFSDASTRFGAADNDGTFAASKLDIIEHGGHGRLLSYDPATDETRLLMDGINFANGVTLSYDQKSVLVNETGTYRVIRYWLEGPRVGESEILIDALPGFPDNIVRGKQGRYWIGLISPRNELLDQWSEQPFLRTMLLRLPEFMRPDAIAYGHVIAIDDTGKVLVSLQDPKGTFSHITGVLETESDLYLSSLTEPAIGRLSKDGLFQ